jgi:penicillin-binding protein 1C
VFEPGYPVAVKTGTSHDYRDNWTVGYTPEVTVAVWVGNFDGRPMGNVSGITGAGPLFREVMDLAMQGRPAPPFAAPSGIVARRVCALSGALPGPGCSVTYEEVFAAGTEPTHECGMHRVVEEDGVARVLESYPAGLIAWARGAHRPLAPASSGGGPDAGRPEILHPGDGALFSIDPDVPEGMQLVEVRLAVPGGADAASLLVDGRVAAEAHGPPWILPWVLEPGDHVLVAVAGGLRSDPVGIGVE